MLPAFLIGLFAVAVLTAILIQQNGIKKANADAATPNVKTVKLKNAVKLVTELPLELALVIERNSWWKSMFGNSTLFPQPRSGDTEFDAMFCTTAYRQDVVDVLRASKGLRASLMQLARDTPSFSMISLDRGKLKLTLSGRPKDEKLAPIRSTLAALAPTLLKSFEALPPDTPKEARTRLLDLYGGAVATVSVIGLVLFSFTHDQPLASSAIPWLQILSLAGAFLTIQSALLFALTTQGMPRKRGLIAIVSFSLMFSCSACPPLVRYLNTLSHQETMTETITVAALTHVEPKKGTARYYIILEEQPVKLAFAFRGNNISLEVDRTLYEALESQSVQHGKQLEIEESTGLLGLPYVVDARLR